MQGLKSKFDGEDRAVSPVIGVILMVAITVILAAVIASFVIGLGDETDDVSPNIVFDADFDIGEDDNSSTITIDTADGDADPDTIYVRSDAIEEDDPTPFENIGAGESIEINDSSADLVWDDDPEGGEEITIVFETDDTSDTLDTFTVPEP